MIAGFKVIAPGLFTTIQDRGRRGYQNIGVPVSGALDRIALTLANGLAGNGADAPALEMLVQGPTLEVVAASVRVAVVGTESVTIAGEASRTVPAGRSLLLMRGERISFGAFTGLGAYLAVEGGFAVQPVLGSAATYVRNRIGGIEGRTLQVGDVLAVHAEAAAERAEVSLASALEPGFDRPIRVVLGPQDNHFTEAAIEIFLSEPFVISRQADRMGFRLEGPKLTHRGDSNIVSDGIVAGAVQVPGSGQPIVLLADAQTAGGYPKIATVISADIPLLVRRSPGRAVRFAAVTVEEAEGLRRAQEVELASALGDLHPVEDGPVLSHEALHSANLVGGVASATEHD
ncbi:MAG: biotin-dependent carboxyltransferase family protein [Bauldia sp.]